jgi:hypothetical protein
VDGSSVAHANADRSGGQPDVENILSVAQGLYGMGFTKILIVLDAGAERVLSSKPRYRELGPACKVISVPVNYKAGEYIILYARLFSAYVISNDRFRDWKEGDQWARDNIDQHLVTFNILDGVAAFDRKLR